MIGMGGLYQKIGRYCFLPIAFNLVAVFIFMLTNKWRKRSEKATETATDARVNELNSSLKNIKVLKLYGWQQIFLNRIEDSRKLQEKMALIFELKKKCNFFFMMVVVRMMRPTILVLAASHG